MHNKGAEFSQEWIEESRNNRIMLAIGGSFAHAFYQNRIILDITLVTVSSLVSNCYCIIASKIIKLF